MFSFFRIGRSLSTGILAIVLVVLAPAVLGCSYVSMPGAGTDGAPADSDAETNADPADTEVQTNSDPAENYALQFRGDDHVTMGSMNLSGHSITIQAWVKPTRFPNTLHTIAGMERSGEAAALLRVGDVGLAASKPQFVVQIGDSQAKLSAESRLETGEWQHVAATYDGSHMRLYIDGELDAIRDQDGRMSANGVFRVARSFGGRYFYGTIDEVEVWRAALSQDRIQEGISERLDQRGGRIMGYWPFDEGEGGRSGQPVRQPAGRYHQGRHVDPARRAAGGRRADNRFRVASRSI